MDSKSKKFLLFFATLAIAYSLARYFDIIDYYTIPSSLMEPSYKTGSYIISSNLKEEKYNSVIVFRDTSLEIKGYRKAEPNVFVGRIVGMGGDVLEIKDGIVYINNDNSIDLKNTLKFGYKIGDELINKNLNLISQLNDEDRINYADSMIVYLTQVEFSNFSENNKLKKLDHNFFTKGIVKNPFNSLPEGKSTNSNFGPLKIPPRHCFILGDNRHKSEDSRLRGYVPIEDILGVVIN